MAWTIENECILQHPVSSRPVTGKRVYDECRLVAEIYEADDADLGLMIKAPQLRETLKDFLCQLNSCLVSSELNQELMPYIVKARNLISI